MGGVGESRTAPVSFSEVDGGNSLKEDVQFKVLPNVHPNKATKGLFTWR